MHNKKRLTYLSQMKEKMNRYLIPGKIIFFISGIAATIWFLIRVIPKPSRAAYPCMRAAAPLASSFILYLLSITTLTVIFRKAGQRIKESRYAAASLLAAAGFILSMFVIVQDSEKVAAAQAVLEPANSPEGTGKGIFPGRVVWVYEPDATDENCTNSDGDYWWQDDNTDQSVVNEMLSDALQAMTGEESDADAWDAIFRYYNSTHGNGDAGYESGEKIVIKINLNGAGNVNPDANINTSPQICYAILDQLVNIAGVAQDDIYLGDPNCSFTDATADRCTPSFPDVNYWNYNVFAEEASDVLIASNGDFSDPLPQAYIDAKYMINIPVLKKHHRAGISLCSKNHFGSIAPFTGGAWHLHDYLPCPNATGEATNGGYGVYRCLVDIMGHKDLGGKTILFLIDGLWGSTNWGHPPVKWRMSPFDNDWPSSLFLSQDPVAIESVGFDFLFKEFDENHPTEGGTPTEDKGPFPQFSGTDDYLSQAANPDNWPKDSQEYPGGIQYDPENDGSVLTSLGVHEHWNNATDKQYSGNLGSANGIELVGIGEAVVITPVNDLLTDTRKRLLKQNYPNPFCDYTTIYYEIEDPAQVTLNIYTIQGQLVKSFDEGMKSNGYYEVVWDGTNNNGQLVSSGMYMYTMVMTEGNNTYEISRKMMVSD